MNQPAENSQTRDLRGPILVAASFALIFAFSSVDHAIAPLVSVFADFFAKPQERVLWLISSCTLGIVLGIIAGPSLLKSWSASKLLNAVNALLAVSLALFLCSPDFCLSLALRFVFGLGSGLLSTCMWWLTYEGLDKKYYAPMVTVLMAARPMAVAAGVPLAGLVQAAFGWRAAFGVFLALIIIGGAAFALRAPDDASEKKSFAWRGIFSEYSHALALPHAKFFYGGLLVAKLCYFGMYSLIGIWLQSRYGLGVKQITSCLIFIGLAETLVNFITAPLLKLNYKKVFLGSMAGALLAFVLFIPGKLPLPLTLVLIALFVMLDRVYSMGLVMTLPQMLPGARNKAALGNLITLSSWTGLTIISWLEGEFLPLTGLDFAGWALAAFLAIGLWMLYLVQSRTVLDRQA